MSGTFKELKPVAVAEGGKATVSGRIQGPLQLTVVPGAAPGGTGAVTFVPAAPPGISVVEKPLKDADGTTDLVLDVTQQDTKILMQPLLASEISVAGDDFTLIIGDALLT